MIQIVPTTTLAQLQANNTSASDSFQGFLPGDSKPGNVSRVKINVPQQSFFHRQNWWDEAGHSHPHIGYSSYDPVYCAKTADDMQARGANGCFLDWYGKGHNTDRSLLVLRPELEKRGMKFALCVDAGIPALKALPSTATDTQRTAVLLDALAYARATYFSSPGYLRDGGKPVILFFGFNTGDFNWSTQIRKAYADCKLIFRWEYQPIQYSDRPYADGYFGWTSCSPAWIANLRAHAPGKLIILGANGGFDNTDFVLCPWGKDKPKFIDQRGGLTFQDALALCRAYSDIPYLSINTWDDYQEKSEMETGYASGKTVALTEINGLLSWTDPGAAFDHYRVLVSQDGVGFMDLDVASAPTYDLTKLDFADQHTYSFVVQAVGKPIVQNVLSNVVQASLAWK